MATNHHRQDLDEPGRCRRYDRISADAAAGWGRIDRDALGRMLDPIGRGDVTLQAMVFGPADRVLQLATGSRATTLAPVRIDLRRGPPGRR